MNKNILIAGVGGASLGTEIIKCLKGNDDYTIMMADISPYAYGIYDGNGKKNKKSFIINRACYIDEILRICINEKVDAIIPGGEEPLEILNENREKLDEIGVNFGGNSKEVISACKDKINIFQILKEKGFPIPLTEVIDSVESMDKFTYPCIIKPSLESGGSVFTYLAEDKDDAKHYVEYLKRKRIKILMQEYISHKEGEFTIGVLSLRNGDIVGSIAMKRSFNAKLSCMLRYDDKIISSGYSQGLIDDFDDIRLQAENLAKSINSTGPLNIQGRIKDGILYPFEMNARFSASTYLRKLAGFNEVDIFLKSLFGEESVPDINVKTGYYFRSLEEKYINPEDIKNG